MATGYRRKPSVRPKQTIGDNHASWKEIRIEKPPLHKETDVVAQSDGAQSTRAKSGNGAPRGIASGEVLSTPG